MAALQKQAIPLNFSQGLDLKTDEKQVQLGKFLALRNSVFSKGGLLEKRNGFGELASLPDTTSLYATTFGGGLVALGKNLNSYNESTNTWVTKDQVNPVSISVLPLVRNNTNQIQADSVVASNGLVCTVYTENVPDGMGGVTPSYKYVVANSVTGQNIIAPSIITPATGVVAGSPRVFSLGKYFVIVFTNNISGTYHLQYIAINSTTNTVTANVDISSQYTPSSTVNFDGCVVNNSLYLAWNANTGGGAIKLTRIDSTLALYTAVTFAGRVATLMSVTADETGSTPVIYASFYNSADSTGYTLAINQNLSTVHTPTQVISSETVVNINSTAQNGVCRFFYEVTNAYSYDSGIATNYIKSNTITQSGTVGTSSVLKRSVGLASKGFLYNGTMYTLAIYSSAYQPTYFLIDQNSNILSKFAYENGPGYYTLGLSSALVTGSTVQAAYLFKDLIQSVNKNTNVPAGSQVAGIYAQLGINLISIDLNTHKIVSSEIGNNLNISGGYLQMYDGLTITEQGFHIWPDSIEATWSATGGSIHAQPDGATNTSAYFYQVTYEWSDNQGNLFRSAPSIPISVTTTGSGTAGSITINVPTLRLTSKLSNPVKIVIYRWSVAQQAYYQVTSIASPVMNDPTADSIAYVDTLADATILGNNLIYTSGGVLENLGAPSTSLMTLFQSRVFIVDAEDPNLIWYSKLVIESTPVEMSDNLTLFVAPTLGVSGSTGPITALFAMDDKLLVFKKDAIYYINGSGPDSTGANSQFSDPVFITASVGSIDQQSLVLTPQGVMFQSDKGIWLLNRGLGTEYIGAPVESLTQDATTLSSISIPATNQIRFTLDSGVTLMYDYYFQQWGEFANIPAISSTIFNGLHTYINEFGQVFQETPGQYLDGSSPVLMSFTTSWIQIAGLQGFQRAYYFYLLGTYLSPHKLNIEIAYDYAPSPSQTTLITPDNATPAWGDEQLWGSGSGWGGPGSLEQWRIFLQNQKCESFQVTMTEVFDPSVGQPAGAGLTLSGLNLVVGIKKGYFPLRAARSAG